LHFLWTLYNIKQKQVRAERLPGKLEFIEIYRCGEMIYFAKIIFASPGYRNIANSFCSRKWLL